MDSSFHVVVLVLGDVGRSPRMQYHARSFSQLSVVNRVTIVGYSGERPMDALTTNSKVHFRYLSPMNIPAIPGFSLLRAILKGFILLFTILYTLISIPTYQFIIIQNPPCLPAIIVAGLLSCFQGSKIIIDWHNLGFSMYEVGLGRSSFLSKFSYFLEKITGRNLAHRHICVSNALKDWLKKDFGIDSLVLYDRPGSKVSENSFSVKDRHDLLLKLRLTDINLFGDNADSIQRYSIETIQTVENSSGDVRRKGEEVTMRTALIISSTSWTSDEDFSILFRALGKIESFLSEEERANRITSFLFQRVVCVITGKGELKTFYEKQMEEFNTRSKFVKMKTMWLEFQDYPKLLYCSDVGVSLHTSTSGLDLPMKVVDMFGSSLPVVAVEFPTIYELVNELNGFVFRSEEDLVNLLKQLFFSEEALQKKLILKLRQNCQKLENWDSNWNKVMPSLHLPIFKSKNL